MAKVMIWCLIVIVIVSSRAYVMRNARISRSASAPEMCSGGESAASRKKSILGRSVKRLGATTDKSRQAPRTKKSLKNLIATSREEITPEEQARLEWEELERAEAAAGDTFQDALQAKLDGWKRLKEEGVLDKIDETFSEDDIREIDELSERLLQRRISTKSKSKNAKDKFTIHGVDPTQLASEFSSLSNNERLSEDEKIYVEYSEKLKKVGGQKKGTASGVMNLINELNDKDLLKGQGELMEDCLMALSRLDSAASAAGAYRQYLTWVRAGMFSEDDFETHSYPYFAIGYANSCFSNGLISAGQEAMEDALSRSGGGSDEDEGPKEVDFLPGRVCASIFEHAPSPIYEGSTYKEAVTPPQVLSELETLYEALPLLSADQVNIVIRMLGKKRLIRDIFALLDNMRLVAESRGGKKTAMHAENGVDSASTSISTSSTIGVGDVDSFTRYEPPSAIRPNDESLEFLANALVASVEEESTSRTMKDLPSPLRSSPEVLLVGRSNVGKSSLVNFLVNRKAMASVSATPGHTTQFHFFGVNSGRADLPSFRFVDVPGLGYAEAEDNTVVSWKSLLQRYLAVRDSLGVVLHLIDSRHKLTPIDKALIDMAVKAADERGRSGSTDPFRYCVVLTKCDRALEKDLRATLKDVKENIAPLSDSLYEEVPIVVSSAIERRGRDDIWKVLQDFVVR